MTLLHGLTGKDVPPSIYLHDKKKILPVVCSARWLGGRLTLGKGMSWLRSRILSSVLNDAMRSAPSCDVWREIVRATTTSNLSCQARWLHPGRFMVTWRSPLSPSCTGLFKSPAVNTVVTFHKRRMVSFLFLGSEHRLMSPNGFLPFKSLSLTTSPGTGALGLLGL